MRKAAVTGGSGYFGSILCQQLSNLSWKIVNLDIIPGSKVENCKYAYADVTQPEGLKEQLAGVDTVFHNVALVPITKSDDYSSVNLYGTKNVIEAAIDAGVRSFVYTSSSAIYGAPKSNPISENSLAIPAEPYGQSKLSSEHLLATYTNKINISIVRPRTILGHGRLGIFEILFDWVKKGWNVPVLGDGSNIYQFVHADDLADACIKCADATGLQFFNIGAEEYSTMRDTLEALTSHAKTGSKVVSLPQRHIENLMRLTSNAGISPLGSYHSLMYGRSLYFDTSKAKTELGWSARYSNIDSIISSYDSYLQSDYCSISESSLSPHSRPLKQGVLSLAGRALNLLC
jgi:nucleoside-diphosphate-sugar epimerase